MRGGTTRGEQRAEEPAEGGGGSAHPPWIFEEACLFLCDEGYFWESVRVSDNFDEYTGFLKTA